MAWFVVPRADVKAGDAIVVVTNMGEDVADASHRRWLSPDAGWHRRTGMAP